MSIDRNYNDWLYFCGGEPFCCKGSEGSLSVRLESRGLDERLKTRRPVATPTPPQIFNRKNITLM